MDRSRPCLLSSAGRFYHRYHILLASPAIRYRRMSLLGIRQWRTFTFSTSFSSSKSFDGHYLCRQFCTSTLDAVTDADVCQYSGFQTVDRRIRSSLHWSTIASVHHALAPLCIAQTIVFVDGRVRKSAITTLLTRVLVE